jgi:hypothetical protein
LDSAIVGGGRFVKRIETGRSLRIKDIKHTINTHPINAKIAFKIISDARFEDVIEVLIVIKSLGILIGTDNRIVIQ